jgi:aryl sulfotransferase
MSERLPTVSHIYQNYVLDSTLWQRYLPRSDDIVVTSSYKSGTTWVQAILAHLILGTRSIPDIGALSPWFDLRFTAVDDTLERLEAQQHRRFIKSHLALDGLLFYPQVKYIVVGRDARDVFMSMWNHLTNFADAPPPAADAPAPSGPPDPPTPDDIHVFWHDWITRGAFAWESEGYPHWGNLHHTKTWWKYRHLDNILFVHFNDLLADLSGEIQNIAQFLDITCSDQQIAEITHAVTFATMKQTAAQLVPYTEALFKGGAQTFIFKGTNGRWKDVLSPEELRLYRETITKVVPPDCAAWLEQGRAALPLSRAQAASTSGRPAV